MLKILMLIFVIVCDGNEIAGSNEKSNEIEHHASSSTSAPTTTPTTTSTTSQPAITHSLPMTFIRNDLLFLSELPLDQLLKVKKSINEIQQVNRFANIGDDVGVVDEQPRHHTHHHHKQQEQHDEKPTVESRMIDNVPFFDEMKERILNNAPTLPLMNANNNNNVPMSANR
jgi:hypothetical protein